MVVGLGLGLGCEDKSSTEKAPSVEAKPTAPSDGERAPVEWKEHSSEKCGFALALPGPKFGGQLPVPDIIDTIGFEDADRALSGMCIDEDLGGDGDEILDALAEALRSEYPGGTAKIVAIEHQGLRGREVSVQIPAAEKRPEFKDDPGDLDVRMRLFVVGRRIYQLQALSLGSLRDEEVERFFASFRLLDGAPQPKAPSE